MLAFLLSFPNNEGLFQPPALDDGFCKKFVDFLVPWHGLCFTAVRKHHVIATLPHQPPAVALKEVNQVFLFHGFTSRLYYTHFMRISQEDSQQPQTERTANAGSSTTHHRELEQGLGKALPNKCSPWGFVSTGRYLLSDRNSKSPSDYPAGPQKQGTV